MAMNIPDPVATVDARDLACPLPLLKAKQGLRPLNAGDCLLVLATDPGSCRDIPAWCEQVGHRLWQQREDAGVYHFWLSKTED